MATFTVNGVAFDASAPDPAWVRQPDGAYLSGASALAEHGLAQTQAAASWTAALASLPPNPVL